MGAVAKVVLTQRADSGYDDVPGELYHFPRKYLRAAEGAVGDGCIFYESRRSAGRQSYLAFGIIDHIYPDPSLADHFYAKIEQFLQFPEPVHFQRADGSYWESKVERPDGGTSKGAMGVSIRRIPDNEFELILKAGLIPAFKAIEQTDPPHVSYGVAEEQIEFERPVIEQISQRWFRDRAFSAQVRSAYDSRCAVTGLKIINGGGRAEMEAAHIKPVAHKGPDSVRNGLALSRTVHWMFDRGLISVDDDFKLLTAKPLLPEGVDRLFNPSGEIWVPPDARARPHPAFLKWHRENRFKG